MAKAAKPTKAKAKAKPQTEPVSRLGWLPATVSQAELAELLGISTRVVRDYQSRGIIVMSPQPGRYLTMPSINGYLTSLRNKAMGRANEDGPSLADERAKSEAVNRKIAEIKLAQLQGEVLTLDEVSAQWSQLCAQMRAAVLALPSKARSTIPHLTPHDGEVLRTLAREVLSMLAEEVEGGVVGADAKDLVVAE